MKWLWRILIVWLLLLWLGWVAICCWCIGWLLWNLLELFVDYVLPILVGIGFWIKAIIESF